MSSMGVVCLADMLIVCS